MCGSLAPQIQPVAAGGGGIVGLAFTGEEGEGEGGGGEGGGTGRDADARLQHGNSSWQTRHYCDARIPAPGRFN